ncbi:hypothetical protein AB0L57_25445 [Nocardia sp. NPDC052254]|uniref:hypothetical protein n=1 Tax=Nocardia sp. NPDC052254 TaxID=3155681 RepID=UPI00341A2B41
MSDYLNMNPDGVRRQAESFHSASQALTEAAGSWEEMFGVGDLGDEYKTFAREIVTGFEHVTHAVENWSSACEAFNHALTQSANIVQYTDSQFSGDISKVSFDPNGDLSLGGK